MVVDHYISDNPVNQHYTVTVAKIKETELQIHQKMNLITQEETEIRKTEAQNVDFYSPEYMEHYKKIKSLRSDVNTMVDKLQTLLLKAMSINKKALSRYVSFLPNV